MQIFILDVDIKKNAEYYVDRHVCKIQTEIAQCLCTVYKQFEFNIPDFLYKETHAKHPCVLWLKESKQNFGYGISLGLALHDEYNYRYPKNGKYQKEKFLFNWLKNNIPENLENKGLTPFAQAIPEQYKQENVIQAYRQYYKEEKKHLFKWTNREVPEWIK